MAVKIGSYKGSPTISLNAESKWPFTFGLAKAKLIMAHMKEIEAFVRNQTPDQSDMAYEDRCAEQCGLNGGAR